MKILVISDAAGYDGAQGMLRLVTKYWCYELGWEIDVFFPRGKGADDRVLVGSGMNVVSAIQNGMRYDFVLVNSFLNIQYLDILKNVRLVFWVHEGAVVLWNTNQTIGDIKRSFANAYKVIFQTRYQSEVLFKSFVYDLKPSKVAVVPNGIDFAYDFSPRRDDQGIFRISWIGSVTDRKRPFDLVNAIRHLKPNSCYQVDFVGSLGDISHLGQEFCDFIKQPSQVFLWHGHLQHQESMQILQDSNVFCMTSSDESMPLAPLEAAALGVPVVLSNLAVYEYVGWRHGHNCLMYQVGNIKELSECIKLLRSNKTLAFQISENAKHLASRFSRSVFLEKFTALFCERDET